MTVKFRNYTNQTGFTRDFHMVRNFIVRINRIKLNSINFPWGRWEWMFSLPYLDELSLSKIGIWEDKGKIVAVITYESNLGEVYFIIDPDYSHLKKQMLIYAKDSLYKDGKIKAIILDSDREFHLIARSLGFRPTQDKELNAIIQITGNLTYDLPDRFHITSMANDYDIRKYGTVLYKGFNHGSNVPNTKEAFNDREYSMKGPHVNLNLKIAVVAPNGEFVSYCGMWYDPKTKTALVEPVATDPAYRRMGLGRAAVLEGVIRCGKLGAKQALVGSSQQFYYNIGFNPTETGTWWELKL